MKARVMVSAQCPYGCAKYQHMKVITVSSTGRQIRCEQCGACFELPEMELKQISPPQRPSK